MTAVKVDTGRFKDWLLGELDQAVVWEDLFPGWREGKPVVCPFHSDKKPSLSLSPSGAALCHACGWKCSWVGGFVEQSANLSFEQVLRRLRLKYVGDMVPSKKWLDPHKSLYSSKQLDPIRTRLLKERGIDRTLIGHRRLGWSNGRLIIPVFDEFGCCVNIRQHDALRQAGPGAQKTLSYATGFGEGRLYPLDVIWANPKVYLFEGEPDALLGQAIGLPAISTTGGAGAWKDSWTKVLTGKKVVICYDTDAPGKKGARAIAKAIEGAAKWVKILELPFKAEGKDLTDWIIHERKTIQDFLQLEKEAEYVSGGNVHSEPVARVSAGTDGREVLDVPLAETAKPELIDRQVKTDALVAAVDTEQYGVPKDVELTCNEYADYESAGKIPKKCMACPMPELKLKMKLKLEADRREQLSLMGKPDAQVRKTLCEIGGVPHACDVTSEVTSRYMITRTELTPDVTTRGANKHRHVVREGYILGEVEANRRYSLTGRPILHPDTQQSVQLITKAEPLRAEIDGFNLRKEQVEELESSLPKGDPYDVLMEIYDGLASSVTHIVKRPLLHAAVDLVFFSPLSFEFNGSLLYHGWLEAMICGDTRCGKGYVVENLMKYYSAGELVSGENVSVAGLLGGLETFGRRMQLRWGVIPLHDRGLVAIDEAGDAAQELIARLSRIRSEGVAEITKIGHHHKTMARTRLLWLCNPRVGDMAAYTYGVQAISSVMEKAEDIARLDYAFTVASADVPAQDINVAATRLASPRCAPPLAASHVRWAWSRAPQAVRFTAEAEARILAVHSPELSAKYHGSIPLIQGQNVRVKLARLAAAVAARVFSHRKNDPTVIVVQAKHADCAARLLDEMYKSPAMSYDMYSRKQYRASQPLVNTEELDQMLKDLGTSAGEFTLFLLTHKLTVASIGAASRMDRDECAQRVIAPLIRANVLVEKSNYHVVTPKGRAWLERVERDAEKEAECPELGR